MMRIYLIALGALASCLWSTAALPNDYPPAATLDARAVDVCKAVKVIVTLLKVNKATPFCSSLLGLASTRTSTRTATAFAQTVETSTSNVIEEAPTYYTTVTRTTTRTTVTGTTTVTLQTQTQYIFTQTTLTLAPPPTQTVTSYYTLPATGKRSPMDVDGVPLEERGAGIPPYLQTYASSALSSACKCLSLPTPKTTVTSTTTLTSTSTTTTTTTSTSYFSAAQLTYLTTTTSILRAIPFQPPIQSTTVVQTRTTTSPAAAAIETVSAPFPSQCQGIVAGGQVFNDIASSGGDGQSYDIGGPPSELTLSLCCVRCLDTLNCMFYRVVAPSTCITYARLYPATHMGPATDQCPLGTGTEAFSNPVFDPASEGFSPGPCR